MASVAIASEEDAAPVDLCAECVDARQMSVLHSETFWVPSPEELSSLCRGDRVLICSERLAERFWCEVVAIGSEPPHRLTGRVLDALGRPDPDGPPFYDCGSKVLFERRHIYDIMGPAEPHAASP